MQKSIKMDLYLHNKDLNVTCETIKLLKENIGEKLNDIGICNDFVDVTPKA